MMFSDRPCSPAEMKIFADDAVRAVRLRHRLGPQEASVRAAVHLDEAHGPGPDTLHHFRQKRVLGQFGAVTLERYDGAVL
jgi:hypothetical protein